MSKADDLYASANKSAELHAYAKGLEAELARFSDIIKSTFHNLNELENLEIEIVRLTKKLDQYEGHAASHWDGCHTDGRGHYECLLRKFREVAAEIADHILATAQMKEILDGRKDGH